MTGFDIETQRLELFMFPGACSRVTMNALEEAGLTYHDRMINIFTLEQKNAAYKAINPKCKVPALRIGDGLMTENAAILYFIASQRPSAHLLPQLDDPVRNTQGLIDLIWCSSTLHIIARQIRNPARLSKGDTQGVYDDGTERFHHECRGISERVADGRWWYGADWSIVDVYLNWAYVTAEKGGFPLKDYPAIKAHGDRVRERPSYARAFAREKAQYDRYRADLPADLVL